MRAFTYERATDAGAAVAAASRAGREVHQRRHQSARPDEARDRAAGHLVDISRLPLRDIEELPDGGLRIGAQAANSDVAADAARAHPLPGAVAGAAGRRLGPAAQQGVHRRQPAAAHPLPLLLRHRTPAATSAIPAPAARRSAGSTGSTRSSGASDACIATHPSDMAVAMTALDARDRAARRRRGDPPRRHRGLPPAAGRHAAHRDRAAARAR